MKVLVNNAKSQAISEGFVENGGADQSPVWEQQASGQAVQSAPPTGLNWTTASIVVAGPKKKRHNVM